MEHKEVSSNPEQVQGFLVQIHQRLSSLEVACNLHFSQIYTRLAQVEGQILTQNQQGTLEGRQHRGQNMSFQVQTGYKVGEQVELPHLQQISTNSDSYDNSVVPNNWNLFNQVPIPHINNQVNQNGQLNLNNDVSQHYSCTGSQKIPNIGQGDQLKGQQLTLEKKNSSHQVQLERSHSMPLKLANQQKSKDQNQEKQVDHNTHHGAFNMGRTDPITVPESQKFNSAKNNFNPSNNQNNQLIQQTLPLNQPDHRNDVLYQTLQEFGSIHDARNINQTIEGNSNMQNMINPTQLDKQTLQNNMNQNQAPGNSQQIASQQQEGDLTVHQQSMQPQQQQHFHSNYNLRRFQGGHQPRHFQEEEENSRSEAPPSRIGIGMQHRIRKSRKKVKRYAHDYEDRSDVSSMGMNSDMDEGDLGSDDNQDLDQMANFNDIPEASDMEHREEDDINQQVDFEGGEQNGNLESKMNSASIYSARKTLSFDYLKMHFSIGLKEAAKLMGVCPTTLKRSCRRHGIKRWPARQVLKLYKSMGKLGYRGEMQHRVLWSTLTKHFNTIRQKSKGIGNVKDICKLQPAEISPESLQMYKFWQKINLKRKKHNRRYQVELKKKSTKFAPRCVEEAHIFPNDRSSNQAYLKFKEQLHSVQKVFASYQNQSQQSIDHSNFYPSSNQFHHGYQTTGNPQADFPLPSLNTPSARCETIGKKMNDRKQSDGVDNQNLTDLDLIIDRGMEKCDGTEPMSPYLDDINYNLDDNFLGDLYPGEGKESKTEQPDGQNQLEWV